MTEQEALITARLARVLWSAVLRSPPGPTRARMSSPQPGDLVVEVSRLVREITDPGAIGRLIWVEGDPDLGGRYVIEPLARPGQEQGWSNARMVAVTDAAGSVLA